jgi:hypothetical protein
MTVKIDKKIVSSRVVSGDSTGNEQPPYYDDKADLKLVEKREWKPHRRPDSVRGTTYKIKPPTMDDAIYVTINNIELEDGTERPIEIFINSKDTSSFMWMAALTRVISALFRQPGDFLFIIDELRQIFDPQGGYFIPGGGGICPSIVAHIGLTLEQHCRDLGMIETEELHEEAKAILEEKAEKAEAEGIKGTECPKCHELKMVMMDGCETCLQCGYSKCG